MRFVLKEYSDYETDSYVYDSLGAALRSLEERKEVALAQGADVAPFGDDGSPEFVAGFQADYPDGEWWDIWIEVLPEENDPIDWENTLRLFRKLGAEVTVERRAKPPYLGDAEYPVLIWRVASFVWQWYDEIAAYPDGTVVITVTWGSADFWDRWVISPDGEIRYCGTVDGPRYLPVWVKLA